MMTTMERLALACRILKDMERLFKKPDEHNAYRDMIAEKDFLQGEIGRLK